ncbi:hypothetical protein CEXT_790741 [Caerostris extrusa]|uniref:Uncharacterized protein n=1 Tax=Caerostris extrusa TaxID=172846 RepID=A0AAV4W042_CAEEX|nr:hypothetical protein CEXT_790741 [Caerostris extrusa]
MRYIDPELIRKAQIDVRKFLSGCSTESLRMESFRKWVESKKMSGARGGGGRHPLRAFPFEVPFPVYRLLAGIQMRNLGILPASASLQ